MLCAPWVPEKPAQPSKAKPGQEIPVMGEMTRKGAQGGFQGDSSPFSYFYLGDGNQAA